MRVNYASEHGAIVLIQYTAYAANRWQCKDKKNDKI